MMFARWLALAFADLVFLVVAYVLAPVLPLFAIGSPTLPRWLAWFQTPDNPLDGDGGWKAVHWQWRYKLPAPLATYVGRVGWLWRNPGYGFDVSVLGFLADPKATITHRGPSALGGALVTGWYFAVVVNSDGARAWQFYAVKVWGSRATRVDFGWKLWSAPGACQFAMSINPFLSVSG